MVVSRDFSVCICMEMRERDRERKRERLSLSLPPVIHTEIHKKTGFPLEISIQKNGGLLLG